jgi:ribosomal protein S18 acetylase RimI-like enzyme
MVSISTLNISDDFTDLITLSRDFFREYESHHKEFFKIDELKNEDITSYFSSFCLQPYRKAYVAINSEHIVGYITVYIKEQANYWQVKKVGEISGLMVDSKFRRKGIAEMLLRKAQDFLADNGIKYYTVYTAVENRGAINFYRKNSLAPLYTTLVGEINSLPGR